jgi:hypothetical protein
MLLSIVPLIFVMFGARQALAQQPSPSGGQIIIPGSSVEHPGDVGIRGHTNIEIFVPSGGMPKEEPKSKNAEASPRCKVKVKPQPQPKSNGEG